LDTPPQLGPMVTKIELRKTLVIKIYLCFGPVLTAMRRVGSPVKKIIAVNVPILYIVNKLMNIFGTRH
jgi:hypothetical protein